MIARRSLVMAIQISLALEAHALVARAAASDGNPEPTCTSGAADRRTLNEHVFTPSETVTDPFTATYFRNTTGYGIARSKAPGLTVLGESAADTTYQQVALTNTLQFQWGPLPFWAVRVSGLALVYMGENTRSALAQGGTLQYRFGFGTTVSWPIANRFRVGATLDLFYAPAATLNVATPLADSVGNGSVMDASLLQRFDPWTIRPGLATALELHRSLGLVLSFQYLHSWGNTISVAAPGNALALGGTLDFGLRSISPVPIDLALSYLLTLPVSQDDTRNSQNFDIGVFYAGRPDLVLGPEVSLRKLPQGKNVDTLGLVLFVVARVYW